jgi:dihydroflavonol-4-reductase
VPDHTVLVTGVNGFVAGHCVKELLAHGYAVRGSVRNLATADVDHLHALASAAGTSLELVEANLDSDGGWDDAVAGCAFVCHVASPNPAEVPRNEDDLIRPAVDGTLRVLRAAAKSGDVRRVVLTSSLDAVFYGHGSASVGPRTEDDWTKAENSPPYPKSKTYAERAAWEFVRNSRLELVTVLPGLILGPLLHAHRTPSVEVIRKLLAREVPATPRIGFAVVDVRDVAAAHRLALETPEAAGNRYICAGAHTWTTDIAAILAAEFGPRGYRIPTGKLPLWLMWVLARFDKAIRLAFDYARIPKHVSAEKAKRELGWTPRPAVESVIATAESLVEFGVVRRSRSDSADHVSQAARSA